jgi:hypothetical protein
MLRVERLGDPRDPLPLRTELEDAAHDPCPLLVNRADYAESLRAPIGPDGG